MHCLAQSVNKPRMTGYKSWKCTFRHSFIFSQRHCANHHLFASEASDPVRTFKGRCCSKSWSFTAYLTKEGTLTPNPLTAEYGQVAAMELLLNRGADPTIGTSGDRLPLHFAAEEGHLPIVKLLLQHPTVDSEKRDFTGQTALFKAANKGRHAVVELLLQQPGVDLNAKSKDGFTPLLTAVFGNHAEVVRLLLDRPDVDPNLADTSYQQTPLWMAVTGGEEMVQIFLARKDININGRSRRQETPLYQAIQRNRLPIAQLLLNAGADPNIGNWDDQTPLGWAAADGTEEAIDMLLKQPRTDVNHIQKSGQAPLSRAAENGHAKCVKRLLAKGAEVESTDLDGNTALLLGAANGHKIVVKMLLKSGAKINVQNKNGNTPLALAATNNHDAVVRVLLESGADAEVPDEDEETPFEKARDGHLDQIVEVFEEVLRLRRGLDGVAGASRTV